MWKYLMRTVDLRVTAFYAIGWSVTGGSMSQSGIRIRCCLVRLRLRLRLRQTTVALTQAFLIFNGGVFACMLLSCNLVRQQWISDHRPPLKIKNA
jgi:hypothetical protein